MHPTLRWLIIASASVVPTLLIPAQTTSTWAGDSTANQLLNSANWTGATPDFNSAGTNLLFNDSGSSYTPSPLLAAGYNEVGSLTFNNGNLADWTPFVAQSDGTSSGSLQSGINISSGITLNLVKGAPDSVSVNLSGVINFLSGAVITGTDTSGTNSSAYLYLGATPGAGGLGKVSSTGPITISGGAFDVILRGDASGLGTVNLVDGFFVLGPGSSGFQSNVVTDSQSQFTINAGSGNSMTYSGVISGNGQFVANTPGGTVILNGNNTYTGSTVINRGTLQIGTDNALPTSTVLSIHSGTTLDVASNQTIDHFSSYNYFGTITLENNKTLTINPSSTTQSTYAGLIQGDGSLVVGGLPTSLSATAWSITKLTNANTFTGGTTVTGGVLILQNTSGSALGTGNVSVGSGAALYGSGGFTGALSMTNGSYIVPMRSLSVGATTLHAGSAIGLVMSDTTQGAGTGWGLLQVSGSLKFADTSAGAYTLSLIGLNSSGDPALISNFNPATNYTFTIATASSLVGFDPSEFTIDTSRFQNAFNGTWSVEAVGSNLDLAYVSAVPEPPTYAILLGMAAFSFEAIRRRNKAKVAGQ